jgi:hypothetical protein
MYEFYKEYGNNAKREKIKSLILDWRVPHVHSKTEQAMV